MANDIPPPRPTKAQRMLELMEEGWAPVGVAFEHVDENRTRWVVVVGDDGEVMALYDRQAPWPGRPETA